MLRSTCSRANRIMCVVQGSGRGAGKKLEGVAVALPYLVTFRSRMLARTSKDLGTAADKARPYLGTLRSI